MGNEVSTLGGGAATIGTAVLAGVTLGQVDDFNRAVVDAAKFTADHAEKTVVRHVGETLAMAFATAGVSVASGVTFGQIDALNDAVVHCAKHTAEAGERAGAELLSVADGLTDSIPVVGHVKGGIFYAAGNSERGDRAMKSSSRTVGVIGGGVGGFVMAGPVGAVAGGVAGGAAMDGVITGAESAIHKEFRPHGQIASWHQVARATSNDERIGGIVSGVMTPVVDGFTGYASGRTADVIRQRVATTATTATTTTTATSSSMKVRNLSSTNSGNPQLSMDSAVDNSVFGSAKLKAAKHSSSSSSHGGGAGTNSAVVKPVAGGVGFVTVATNIDSLFTKFSNGEVKEAVDDALGHVVRLAKERVQEHLSRDVASNGELGDGATTATTGDRAKPTLQHMWGQVVKQFKEGIAERSGAIASTHDAGVDDLGSRDMSQRVSDTLQQALGGSSTTTSGATDPSSVDGLVKQAMGALGGFVGGKTAEVLRDVANSEKSKEALQHLWGQVTKKFKDALEKKLGTHSEPVSVDAGADDSSSETAGALVATPQLGGDRQPKGSELFFVLIVIYAALSALMMASQK